MANPRTGVDFTGINAPSDYVTMKYDGTIVYDATQRGGSAQVGKAVTLVSARTVTLSGNGEPVYGRLELVESDGKCTVVKGGYVTLPAGASAAVGISLGIVGALGPSSAEGYIRQGASGTAAEAMAARGQIVDATDLTAVIVMLS
jgi:hypothetical protein